MAIIRKRSISELFDKYLKDLEEWTQELTEPFIEKPSWNVRNHSIEPLRETSITPSEVLITLDLPFTDKGAVKVKPFGKNILEITAKMNRVIKSDELGVRHWRGEFQKYHSHMRIPVKVDMDKMEIKHKKGLLEIRLPRKH